MIGTFDLNFEKQLIKNYAEENSIDLNGATKKADIINEIVGK